MKEMGRNQQLRTGEVLIIVVVLFMWAGESGLRALLHLTSGEWRPLTRSLLSQKRRVRGLEAAERQGEKSLSPALGSRLDPFSNSRLTKESAY